MAVRLALTEHDPGFQVLHALAHQKGRTPAKQAYQLILYGLSRHLDGEDVELSPSAFAALSDEALEPVA